MNLYINRFTFALVTLFAFSLVTNADDKGRQSEGRFNQYQISSDSLFNKIEELESNVSLTELEKNQIIQAYHEADENLRNTEWYQFKFSTFQDALNNGPAKLKKLNQDIDQLKIQLKLPQRESYKLLSIEALERQMDSFDLNLLQYNQTLKRIENDLDQLRNRPKEIREEILSAKTTLAQVPEEAVKASSVLEQEALWFAKKTRQESAKMEISMLEAENLSQSIRQDLLSAEKQVVELNKKRLLPKLNYTEQELNEKQKHEQDKRMEELALAELEASGKHLTIRYLTKQNYTLNKQLLQIKTDIQGNEKAIETVEELREEIEKDFKSAEKKINLAGISPALGRVLREQRRKLENSVEFSKRSNEVQQDIIQTTLKQFNAEERYEIVVDTDKELERIQRQEFEPTLTPEQIEQISADIELLLNEQADLLQELITAYSQYLRRLGDFDFSLQQYLKTTENYTDYLDERLFWVKSASIFNLDSLLKLPAIVSWFADMAKWRDVRNTIFENSSRNSFLIVLALFTLLSLILAKYKAEKYLAIINQKVSKLYSDSFYYTIQAFTANILLAAPIPLALWVTGWLCRSIQNLGLFSYAFGQGLTAAAVPLFFLNYFYLLFARNGIFVVHFQWQSECAKLIENQINWIRFIAPPALFLITMTGNLKESLFSDVLGRLGLVLSLLIMALALTKILNPKNALMKGLIERAPNSWFSKLRYLWYHSIWLIPLLVAGFALYGYYLSALELQQKLIVTLRFIFFVIVIYQIIKRWLMLVNRQLALQNARKKRKAAEQSGKQSQTAIDENALLEEQLLDISKINAQTVQVINVLTGFLVLVGLVMIWKNIIPAFSFLDDVILWQYTVDNEGQQSIRTTTLLSLCLAGLYIFVAFIAVKNLPGLMEVFIFRHFSVNTGSRYAINQIVQYSITAIIFISVANELGGSWSQVQWLVAALSVGLGFGLQEIFANFISGIILLFERPIRIGDTVTIGDVTGSVNKIRMRATTITDWDQKELVVPNKTFITEQLINWSLSSSTTRIVIPVGVAYGSDTGLVEQAIREAISATANILKEPEPMVLFLGFGDSSLDFSVRVYVAELGHRLKVTHELHNAINRQFKEKGIEIPFPQRDVHIRSTVMKDFAQEFKEIGEPGKDDVILKPG